MAGNPAAAIEEAIGAAMDGWKAEDVKELYAFIKGFPDVLDKLRESFAGIVRDADERGDLESNFGEDLDVIDSCLGNGHDAAETFADNFYNHFKFFLADDES